jgi:benzodiazapine receptor
VAIAALTNGALSAMGLNPPDTEVWPAFAPPGYAIGAIWVALFGLMGAARWLVVRERGASAVLNGRAIVVLVGLCLAYPFYTHVVGGHAVELAGNIVTFAVAAVIAARLRRQRLAAAFVGAVAVWIGFATVLVVALVTLNGWRT